MSLLSWMNFCPPVLLSFVDPPAPSLRSPSFPCSPAPPSDLRPSFSIPQTSTILFLAENRPGWCGKLAECWKPCCKPVFHQGFQCSRVFHAGPWAIFPHITDRRCQLSSLCLPHSFRRWILQGLATGGHRKPLRMQRLSNL